MGSAADTPVTPQSARSTRSTQSYTSGMRGRGEGTGEGGMKELHLSTDSNLSQVTRGSDLYFNTRCRGEGGEGSMEWCHERKCTVLGMAA